MVDNLQPRTAFSIGWGQFSYHQYSINIMEGDEDKALEEAVGNFWETVKQKREEKQHSLFLEKLATKAHSVKKAAAVHTPARPPFRKLLPSQDERFEGADDDETNMDESEEAPYRDGKANNLKKSKPIVLSGSAKPIPHRTALVLLSKSYSVDDKESLSFVPSAIGDAEGETNKPHAKAQDYFSLFDLNSRVEAMANGPAHEANERDASILETIELVEGHLSEKELSRKALSMIAKVAKVEVNLVVKLYDNRNGELSDAQQPMEYCKPVNPTAETSVTAETHVNESSRVEEKDNIAAYDPEYLKAVDSYRRLYCKRCFIYDCNYHAQTNRDRPSLKLSYELGIFIERERTKRRKGYPPRTGSVDIPNQVKLTEFEKTVMQRLFLIFEGDLKSIARVLRAPVGLVKQYIEEKNWQLPRTTMVRNVTDKHPYYSIRNYNPRWYSRCIESGLRPLFEPCTHDEPCGAGVCSCVSARLFCTNECAWGSKSRNFFRGCTCKGSCKASHCSCWANAMECDPDLCACDTCTDPANGPVRNQRCRNDDLTMQRQIEIYIGRSHIPNAGWGAFARFDLQRGDFIGEYVGEIISQDEAERRGQLYDLQNHSSLFMLSADYSLDADKKGNELRFINHSTTPNVSPRHVTVKGDSRISFYARCDIPAETELTFNYGHNFSVNKEFVLKGAEAVPWMDETKKGPEKRRTSKRKAKPCRKDYKHS